MTTAVANPYPKPYESLQERIQTAINCVSAENGSDTPDFILAEYLTDCLMAWNKAIVAREKWYGREDIVAKHQPCER